jgi:hypothetical protein
MRSGLQVLRYRPAGVAAPVSIDCRVSCCGAAAVTEGKLKSRPRVTGRNSRESLPHSWRPPPVLAVSLCDVAQRNPGRARETSTVPKIKRSRNGALRSASGRVVFGDCFRIGFCISFGVEIAPNLQLERFAQQQSARWRIRVRSKYLLVLSSNMFTLHPL